MNELRRLKDEPEFLSLTGCDLGDEQLALEAADLSALGARIQALTGPRSAPDMATPPGDPWTPGWSLGGGAAVMVLFSAWLAWPMPATAPAPTRPDQVVAPAPALAVSDQRAAAPAVAVSPSAAATPRRPSASHVVSPRAAASPPADLLTVAAPLPPPPAPGQSARAVPSAAAPRMGDLAAQLAAFQAAEDLLAGGEGAMARQAYDAYLATWPSGDFSPEARLGALRATLSLGDHEEAQALAATLALDPAFAARREELLAMRAAALVELGRCAEALAVADVLSRTAAAPVRRSCR